MKHIITYLKCIWWNKALLFSYTVFITAPFIILSDCWTGLKITELYLIFVSAVALVLCKFGKHTISTYKRLTNAYVTRGKFIEVYSAMYCDQSAVRWFKWENRHSLKLNKIEPTADPFGRSDLYY